MKQMREMHYIDDDWRNSKKLVSHLRQSGRGKIIYSTCFLYKKDKLHYSKYGSTKYENLIRCELSSVVRSAWSEISLKRVMKDNLEWNNSSLATAKRLKVMISDKDVHSTDVLYHHCCIVCTPPPLCRGGWASNQIFKKGGAWQDLNFRGRLLRKRGGSIFT